MNVQAYILNISAIQTIEELQEMVDNDYIHALERTFYGNGEGDWTAPQWIMQGDIVFFYHAKTANQHNKRLRNYINKHSNEFDSEYQVKLLEYLDYCDNLYNKYGAKIFAVGRVCEKFLYVTDSGWEHPHFKSRIFAPIDNIKELQYPLSVKEFEEFLPIKQQRATTPVFGNDFMKLKELILRYNSIPYLKQCTSLSVPLKDIKSGNWLKSASENRRRYLYEEQFRKYYVDYFLTCLADDSKYYSEISCVKDGKIAGRADNCILFNGKCLFTEVKLNMFLSGEIIEQLQQYCEVDNINLGRKRIYKENIFQDFVIIIDVNHLCFYTTKDENSIIQVEELDNIKSMCDIRRIKRRIEEFMRNYGYEV